MPKRSALLLFLLMTVALAAGPLPEAPSYVDMTWMSIANMYYEIGPLGIVTDGYITRIPQSAFYGGGGGLAYTRKAYTPDTDGITRVLNALGGASKINILLTGHSHFDHSFDTPVWARLTSATVIGPKTTCLQIEAAKIPASRCTAVAGREKFTLADGVTMRVVRFNHSGDSASNPEQHNPMELTRPPSPDPETGGFHGGVAEDFPNGGGVRGFLFTIDGSAGTLSWFYQNSASAADLDAPIVVDGVDYGAPIENLKFAMKDAGLESVDLWIGTGGAAIAQRVVPIIKPKAYLPVHWDGLYSPFNAGMPRAYSDAQLEQILKNAGVQLIKPGQYMDKWRLDRNGVQSIPNPTVKRALGFPEVQTFSR